VRSIAQHSGHQEARSVVSELLSRGAFLLTYRDRLWIYHGHGVSSALWRTASSMARDIQEVLIEDSRADGSDDAGF
jgi:hypothetical protein